MQKRGAGRGTAFIVFFLLLSLAAAPAPAATPSPSPSPEARTSTAPKPTATSAPSATPTPAASPTASAEPKEGELTSSTLPLDISTAGLHELAAWCRSLGLAETGGVEELRTRLYGYYKVSPPAGAAAGERSIEIKSAQTAEYFTIEKDGDSMVRLSGGVTVVMTETKRNWTHEIRARRITFNQSLNLLSARGDVQYKLVKPEGEEFFYGDGIDVDLSTWTGTFLDGRVIRASTGSGLEKKFTFSADVINKGEGDLSVFEDAVISSCDDYAAPHYSIRASKAWILGKSEWGLLNAVLSVGEVPVLYLPFFYYTGEEILFHPVIGTRDREGYFANATIYLLGEKQPAKESISLLALNAQQTGMEKRLVGVYLLSTDKKKDKATSDVFKVMLDAYTNLGILAGIECALSSDKSLPTLNLSAVAALTRNVYSTAAADGTLAYSPYVEAHGWESVWNGSRILGQDLPLRFGLEASSSYQPPKTGLTFSAALPFYSDPYVPQDKNVRSEDMKWFQFLENDATTVTATTAENRRDSLEMKAEAAYAPDLGFLKPYLNSLNLSYLRTKLVSRSRETYTTVNGTPTLLSASEPTDPSRYFFAPEQWTMAEASANLSGTIFSYPFAARQRAAPAPAAGSAAAGKEEAEALPSPRAPWYGEKAAEAEAKQEGGSEGNQRSQDFDPSPYFRRADPKIEGSGALSGREPFTFSLGYTADPSGSFVRNYASSPWKSADDVDWAILHDTRLLRLATGATLNAAIFGSLLKGSAGLSYAIQGQEHYAFNPSATILPQTAINNLRATDYQALQNKLSGSLSLGSNPLQDIPLWSPTALSYALNFTVNDQKYKGIDASTGNPIYETTSFDLSDKKAVSTHSLALTLGALPMGWNESLTLTANLPPLDQSYQAALSLKLWGGTASSTFRRYYDDASKAWKYDDLKLSGSYTFLPKVVLSDNFSCGLNENQTHPVSNALSLTLWDFTASLSHAWGPEKALIDRKWVDLADQTGFHPSVLALGYVSSIAPIYLWKNRIVIKPGLSSSLNLNFQQYTASAFSFAPSISLGVADFLELNFSSTSQNTAVYKYLIGLPGFETNMAIDRISPIDDLLNSFGIPTAAQLARDPAVGATALRSASNFKLKGIKVSAVHHLHDWDLSLSYEGRSELKTVNGSQQYAFNPYFTFNVSWKQIPEIKTDIAKNPTAFTLK